MSTELEALRADLKTLEDNHRQEKEDMRIEFRATLINLLEGPLAALERDLSEGSMKEAMISLDGLKRRIQRLSR